MSNKFRKTSFAIAQFRPIVTSAENGLLYHLLHHLVYHWLYHLLTIYCTQDVAECLLSTKVRFNYPLTLLGLVKQETREYFILLTGFIQGDLSVKSTEQKSQVPKVYTYVVGRSCYALYCGPQRDIRTMINLSHCNRSVRIQSLNVRIISRRPISRRYIEKLLPRHAAEKNLKSAKDVINVPRLLINHSAAHRIHR